MSKIKIITDSNSGVSQQQAAEMGIEVLPTPFIIDGECYQENVTLSRELFFEKLSSGSKVSTSQPTPSEVRRLWDKILKEYDQIVYIPISSGLSGSYEMAASLAQMEEYCGRVFVVNNGRVATPQHQSVLDALEMVNEGYRAEEIKQMLEESGKNVSIYIAVEDLSYMKQGGRISAASAVVGSIMNIKPVLHFDTGLISVFQKCRGTKKAHRVMLDAMKKELETKFKYWYERGEVALLAASSAAPEETENWIGEIRKEFPGMELMCDDLSLSVACHIGPGGLGIGCSCRPERLPKGFAIA